MKWHHSLSGWLHAGQIDTKSRGSKSERGRVWKSREYCQGTIGHFLYFTLSGNGSVLLQRKSITYSLIGSVSPDYVVLYFQCIAITYFSFILCVPEDSTGNRIAFWQIQCKAWKHNDKENKGRSLFNTSSFVQRHWYGDLLESHGLAQGEVEDMNLFSFLLQPNERLQMKDGWSIYTTITSNGEATQLISPLTK